MAGPIDMFKSQIQVQILSQKTASVGASTATQQYKNVFDCARVIASEHGIRGIYQGLSAVLLRNIPANAIYFGMNQETRRLLATEQQPIDQLSPGKLLFAGGVAGFLYWFVTFPADVIKVRTKAVPRSSYRTFLASHTMLNTLLAVIDAIRQSKPTPSQVSRNDRLYTTVVSTSRYRSFLQGLHTMLVAFGSSERCHVARVREGSFLPLKHVESSSRV